ncbi:Predicted oxidoreductase [Kosakonia sacchari]|nr:Predicted oxidoreductase [Kosakonia sacchari]
MSPIPTTSDSGRFVRNGVGSTGPRLTPAERAEAQRQVEAKFLADMRRKYPQYYGEQASAADLSLTQRNAKGNSTLQNPFSATVTPMRFALQDAATLDATGKNSYPAAQIIQDIDSLLSSLQMDHFDVGFFSWPTSETLVDETLGAYASLLKEGKILALGGMDLGAAELTNILTVAKAKGLPGYQVLAVNYNLYDRSLYEGALQDLVVKENIAAMPYTGLASGFLSGKYRTLDSLIDNPLSAELANYFTPRGFATLGALDIIAAKYTVPPASVALAWLMNQPGVVTPLIIDEPSVEGEEGLVAAAAVELVLSAEDFALLAKAIQ